MYIYIERVREARKVIQHELPYAPLSRLIDPHHELPYAIKHEVPLSRIACHNRCGLWQLNTNYLTRLSLSRLIDPHRLNTNYRLIDPHHEVPYAIKHEVPLSRKVIRV